MAMVPLSSFLVIIERGGVCEEDAPPKSCKRLCRIELAQIAKVAFTDDAWGSVAHRIDVKIPGRENVLVVPPAACGARREGGATGAQA